MIHRKAEFFRKYYFLSEISISFFGITVIHCLCIFCISQMCLTYKVSKCRTNIKPTFRLRCNIRRYLLCSSIFLTFIMEELFMLKDAMSNCSSLAGSCYPKLNFWSLSRSEVVRLNFCCMHRSAILWETIYFQVYMLYSWAIDVLGRY